MEEKIDPSEPVEVTQCFRRNSQSWQRANVTPIEVEASSCAGNHRLYAEVTLAMPTEPDKPEPASSVKIVHFDWAMKALLRDKANFAILEGFLHSLLDEPVTIEQILESESNAESENARFNRVDLLVKDSEGRHVIIEVQNERESDYIERMLFGTSKLVVDSIGRGEPYGHIPKIISIHILYFNLGQGTDYVYSGTTELRGIHTDEPLLVSERFIDNAGAARYRRRDVFPEYHVINVDRFNKIDEEDLEMLDQWIYLFKQSEVRGDFDAPGMETARERLAYLKMDQDQRKAYDRHMDNFVRELDIMETGS